MTSRRNVAPSKTYRGRSTGPGHLLEKRHGINRELASRREPGTRLPGSCTKRSAAESSSFLDGRRRSSRRHPSDDVVVLRAVGGPSRIFDGERHHHVEAGDRRERWEKVGVERQRRENAEHFDPLTVDRDGTSDDVAVASETALEERCREKHLPCGAGPVVVFGKDAAEERVDPEKREKRRRGLEGRETLGLDTVTRQRDVPTRRRAPPCPKLSTCSRISKYCAGENQSSETPTPGARGHSIKSRSWSGKTVDAANAVHHAVDRRCRADAERERQDDDRGMAGCAGQASERCVISLLRGV